MPANTVDGFPHCSDGMHKIRPTTIRKDARNDTNLRTARIHLSIRRMHYLICSAFAPSSLLFGYVWIVILRHCHSERSEESARGPERIFAIVILSAAKNLCLSHERFFATLRMTIL